MSNKNLTIDLKARLDKDERRYYVGKLRAPVSIDCSDGVVFLIFVSDEGVESLQITSMDNKEKFD